MGSMRLVAAGIWMVLGGIVLVMLSVIGGLGLMVVDIPPALAPAAGLVIAGAIALGKLASFVGPFFCLAAPAETGSRPFLIASIVCQLIAVGITFLGFLESGAPPWAGVMSNVVSFIGVILFILFLKALTGTFNRPDLDAEADSTITAAIGMAIAVVLAIIPLIQCIGIFIFIGAGLYFLYKYIMLLTQFAGAATAAGR